MKQDIIKKIATCNMIELEFIAKHIIIRQKQLLELRKYNLQVLRSKRK